MVHPPFRSNAKLGILSLGNNRVGVRFFMARALMKILETKEVDGRKEGMKQLRKTKKNQNLCKLRASSNIIEMVK